MTGIVSMIQI